MGGREVNREAVVPNPCALGPCNPLTTSVPRRLSVYETGVQFAMLDFRKSATHAVRFPLPPGYLERVRLYTKFSPPPESVPLHSSEVLTLVCKSNYAAGESFSFVSSEKER
jgi:hypothetical protein